MARKADERVDLWEIAHVTMEAALLQGMFSASWKPKETMAQSKAEGL